MAYADSLRSASATMESAATLIEGSLVEFQRAASVALINTTATTVTDYTSASVTISVASGNRVKITGRIGVSNSNSGNLVVMDIYEDATILDPGGSFYCARGSTAGTDGMLEQTHLRSPSAGSHTYKIRWYTTANTAYSYGFELIAEEYQQV